MTERRNDGIIISGGVVNAQSIVAGKNATAVSVAMHAAGEKLAGRGQDELAAQVEALRAALCQHEDELPDRKGALEMAAHIADELRQERPAKRRLQEFLTQLTTAAGSASAVAGAVTALQETVTSLL